MTDFQYTTVLGKLTVLLDKIRKIGIPKKATQGWLETLGYKSKNDRTMLKVIEFIGFLDESRVPTEVWKKYRGADHQKVLAIAIKTGYAELFNVYPIAWECSTSELESFFSTHTTAGKQVINKTVSTFTTLCGLADFSDGDEIKTIVKYPDKKLKKAEKKEVATSETYKTGVISPSLHINIQIHISADSSTEQIDQIFMSMSKHLKDLQE